MPHETEASFNAPQNSAATEAEGSDSPERAAEHFQAEVEQARDELGDLVGELDRRRHRATKPLLLGAIAVGVVGIGGYLLWRHFKPSALSPLDRITRWKPTHSEDVKKQASATRAALTAAAVAIVSVAAHRAVTRPT